MSASRSSNGYKNILKLSKPHLLADQNFQLYKAGNPWIETLSLFKALKVRFNYATWETWPDEYRILEPHRRSELTAELKDEIDFHSMLEYLCFLQLKEVHAFADQTGIFLKGDIPILVSRDSVDVWHAPQFFDLHHGSWRPSLMITPMKDNIGDFLFSIGRRCASMIIASGEKGSIMPANSIAFIASTMSSAFIKIWAVPLHEAPSKGFLFPKIMKNGSRKENIFSR